MSVILPVNAVLMSMNAWAGAPEETGSEFSAGASDQGESVSGMLAAALSGHFRVRYNRRKTCRQAWKDGVEVRCRMVMDEVKRAHADRMVAAAIAGRQQREAGYREQALRLFPWVCGRCAREFTHANVQQLTVHHRDYDHRNNPKDGSNWELLCVYCHENEHARALDAAAGGQGTADGKRPARPATSQPFAHLKALLGRSGQT